MLFNALTFHATIHQSMYRERAWDRSEALAYQQAKLRSLLLHSCRHIPFQKKRLANLDLRSIDMEAILPTDKTQMMAHFNETVADGAVTLDEVLRTDIDSRQLELPIIRGKYIAVKTSGTSGQPSWLVCDLSDWGRLMAASYSRMAKSLLTPQRIALSLFRPIRTATIAAEHAHSMTWQGARSAGVWAGPFARSRFFSVVDSVHHLAAGLNEFRPEHLHAYPTAAEMLARYRLDGGNIRVDPQLISVGSEPLTEIARLTIREAFPKSRLIDHYGMSECLPLSTECQFGHKHINLDYAILEARDAQGRRCAPGELSDHVLVTNLVNRLQPIIRYRVEDSIRISDDSCPCGSPFPKVEIFSRKGSLVHLKNDQGGWQVLSPPVVVDTMLHTTGVAQYQIFHTHQNKLEVRFQPSLGANQDRVLESIRTAFANVMISLECSRSVIICIQQVDRFERTGVGNKLQQLISHVAPPQLNIRRAEHAPVEPLGTGLSATLSRTEMLTEYSAPAEAGACLASNTPD